MSGTVYQNQMTSAIGITGQKTYWNPKLAEAFLTRNTFFTLIDNAGMGRHPVYNHKFYWGEYDDGVTSVTTTSAGGATQITEESGGTGYKSIVKGDILYDPTNGYHLYVSATPSSTAISVTLVDASSGAATDIDAAITNGTHNATGMTYYKIGKMIEDGSIIADTDLDDISYYRDIESCYNYTQILEDWVKISRQAAAEEWEFKGITRREHARAVKLAHHIDEWEKTFWWGVRVADGDSTNGRWGTRGFFNFQSINSTTSAMSGFDFDNFMTFCREKVMLYNDKEELDGFVNPWMLQKVAEWAENTAHINFDGQGQKDKFGIRVHELTTPQCVIRLRQNRALRDVYTTKAVMAVVDLDKVGIRYLAGNGNNWNTSIEYDVQPAHANFFLDKIYSDLGLEIHNANHHSYLLLS